MFPNLIFFKDSYILNQQRLSETFEFNAADLQLSLKIFH